MSAEGETTVAAPPDAPQSAGRKAAAGALWLSAASIAQQGLSALVTLVLARFLGAPEYGLSVMAVVVVAFANVFVTAGFSFAIATGRLRGDGAVATAHWVTVTGGLALAAAVHFGSPLAALYFRNDAVAGIVEVAALGIVAGTWEVAPQAALQAAGRFDRVAYVTVSAQIASSVASIVMAALGAGVWALVVPQIGVIFVRAIAFTALSPVRLFVRPRLATVRPHFAEFRHVTGITLTDFLFFNAPPAILGRWLGQVPVGLFNFSGSLVNKSMSIFTKTISTPLMVSLGGLKEDRERFDRAVVRSVLALLRMTTPLAVGGAIVAREIVTVCCGDKWHDAVELVRLYFLLSGIQAAGQLTGAVWLALGHARLMFWYGFAVNGAMVAVCALGVWFGTPEAVVLGFIVHTVVALVAVTVPLTRRACGIPLRGLGRGLLSVVRDAAGMAIAVYGVRAGLILAGAPDWLVLAASVGAGALVYVAMFRALSRPELERLLGILPGRMAAPLGRLLAVRAA